MYHRSAESSFWNNLIQLNYLWNVFLFQAIYHGLSQIPVPKDSGWYSDDQKAWSIWKAATRMKDCLIPLNKKIGFLKWQIPYWNSLQDKKVDS